MTGDRDVTIEPVGPLGATVGGLRLGPVSPELVELLRRALADHGVLVIRRAASGDREFSAFMASFGPAVFTTGETPVGGHPSLNVVSNVGRTTPPRSVFHIDTSYLRNPPAYTALRAVVVPEHGGETVFADTFAAYESLDDATRARLASAVVTHTASDIPTDSHEERAAEHPLFLRHPVNGRTALYLTTPARLTAVSGLTAGEAERTIAHLYDHATRPPYALRHRWQSGDVVLWDNRRTLHRADHDGAVGDRILHRAMSLDGRAPM